MAHVLIATPARDFDPTEVAVSWRVLNENGHRTTFATPDGEPSEADDVMLTGRGLDPWSPIPGIGRLTLLGRLLGASPAARSDYQAMVQTQAFRSPIPWEAARAETFDGLLLPGGHRKRGMTPYLESPIVQSIALAAFKKPMPVAAICHGVLVLARTVDPASGRSVLYGRKTTSLTWSLEGAAAKIGKLGRFWDPSYYRTYADPPGSEAGYMSVEREVRRALASADDFQDVLRSDPNVALQTRGTARDTLTDPRPAFIVRDGLYISARWPGDVHTFARAFSDLLHEQANRDQASSASPSLGLGEREPAAATPGSEAVRERP